MTSIFFSNFHVSILSTCLFFIMKESISGLSHFSSHSTWALFIYFIYNCWYQIKWDKIVNKNKFKTNKLYKNILPPSMKIISFCNFGMSTKNSLISKNEMLITHTLLTFLLSIILYPLFLSISITLPIFFSFSLIPSISC